MLEEADVEEEKRDLITREIGKFREIMKVSTLFFWLSYIVSIETSGCNGDKQQQQLFIFIFFN